MYDFMRATLWGLILGIAIAHVIESIRDRSYYNYPRWHAAWSMSLLCAVITLMLWEP